MDYKKLRTSSIRIGFLALVVIAFPTRPALAQEALGSRVNGLISFDVSPAAPPTGHDREARSDGTGSLQFVPAAPVEGQWKDVTGEFARKGLTQPRSADYGFDISIVDTEPMPWGLGPDLQDVFISVEHGVPGGQ